MKSLATLLLATAILTGAGGTAAAQTSAAPNREQQVDATWERLSPREKHQLLRLHRALRKMPPADRQFIHDRIDRFLQMAPEERDQLRKNRARWEQMTPEERDLARQEFRRHRQAFEERWRREHPDGEPPPPWPPRRRPKTQNEPQENP